MGYTLPFHLKVPRSSLRLTFTTARIPCARMTKHTSPRYLSRVSITQGLIVPRWTPLDTVNTRFTSSLSHALVAVRCHVVPGHSSLLMNPRCSHHTNPVQIQRGRRQKYRHMRHHINPVQIQRGRHHISPVQIPRGRRRWLLLVSLPRCRRKRPVVVRPARPHSSTV